MSGAGVQLTLSWPMPDSFAEDDFMVGDANQQAWDLLARWPDWPEPALRLSGPAGVGKTHLATIFARRSGALWFPDASLRLPDGAGGAGEPFDLAACDGRRPVVIDACDSGPVNEHGLFHLLNRVREQGGSALLVSRAAPQHWGLRTPDLVSRLRLSPAVEIAPPDDALFRAILVKLFHDRQLAIDAPVADYLARRLDRSAARARALVARIDDRALSLGRPVTRALAAEVLREAGAAGDGSGRDDDDDGGLDAP
ncbi:hypothetical protein ACFFJB_06370 [Camelimonas abortus]|uniref:DnaA protein n=1 Tax=Camelimonas abortus TaxID=1017184 RepID=A0ABV7LBW9_9HYPH